MKSRKGLRFVHTRLLCEDYKTPATCQVTKVAQGAVYYKQVEADGTLGGKLWIAEERFARIVREDLTCEHCNGSGGDALIPCRPCGNSYRKPVTSVDRLPTTKEQE